METTLITTTHGQYLFSRTKCTSKLEEIRVIIVNDGNFSLEEIAEFVRDCEALRHKTKQVMRSNSPSGFLQGFQQRDNDKTQPCVIFFRDSDRFGAAMFATIQYNRIRYSLKPFKIPANRLTMLEVKRGGFIHDGSATTFAAVTTRLSWLLSNRLVDRIQLLGVDTESPWFKYLTTPSYNQWRFFTIPRARWQTRLIDPETGRRLKHLSKNTRHNFERRDRVLVKHFQGDVEVKLIVSSDELDHSRYAPSKIL